MAEPSKQLVEALFKALWAANLSNYSREYIENLSISLASELANLSGGGGGGSGLENIVEDLTPQLGGTLDLNSNDITGTGNIDITGSVTVSGEFLGDLDGAVFVKVYNNTASTINKGDAVYLTGGNNGDKPHVDLADSSNANKMPALGIVKENINPSSEGQVAVSGKINFSSHGFTAGANLYINGLGTLQETAPTGEGNLIQKIGKVVSPNVILVQGAFRSNATPNLNSGNIFIGNVSNQTSTTPFAISLDTTPQLGGNLDANRNDITGIDEVVFDNTTGPNISVRASGTSVTSLNFNNTSTSTTILTLTDSGNLTVAGTVEGRDLAADGAKLDGIEAGATADQTKADIDALGINASSISGFTVGVSVPADAVFTDTTYAVGDGGLTQRNFTTTLKTKLDGISTNATANPNAIDNVVEDTTPQLGGNLDTNGNNITGNPAIDGRRAIITEADTSRILALEDSGNFIITTSASDTTVRIPNNATEAFTTGTEIDFIRKGAGKLTIQGDADVTLNGVITGSTTITAQWGGATIKKIDTDEWIIVGKINDVA